MQRHSLKAFEKFALGLATDSRKFLHLKKTAAAAAKTKIRAQATRISYSWQTDNLIYYLTKGDKIFNVI